MNRTEPACPSIWKFISFVSRFVLHRTMMIDPFIPLDLVSCDGFLFRAAANNLLKSSNIRTCYSIALSRFSISVLRNTRANQCFIVVQYMQEQQSSYQYDFIWPFYSFVSLSTPFLLSHGTKQPTAKIVKLYLLRKRALWVICIHQNEYWNEMATTNDATANY